MSKLSTGPHETRHLRSAAEVGLEREVEQLREALDSRVAIGSSLGILMLHLRIDADRAFQVLARWSSRSNTKVNVLSQEINAAGTLGHAAVAALIVDLERRGGGSATGPPHTR